MKKPALIILFTCLSLLATSQNPFDEYIQRRPLVSCEDIDYNAANLIRRFYAERKIDSLYQFLDYWEDRCVLPTAARNLRMVLDINQRRFNPSEINLETVENMMGYRESSAEDSGPPAYYNNYRHNRFHSPSISADSIDLLTMEIAGKSYSINTEELLILDFFASGNPSFANIREASEESTLRYYYLSKQRSVRNIGQTHVALATGLVQYSGNTELFGNRANVGFMAGGKHKRHNYDIILAFRIGPSSEPYSFQYQDSTITHREWTGMYLGTEYTFDIIDTRKFDIGLSGGIGYDRITAITADNDIDEDPDFLNSFNKNTGLVFKYSPKGEGLYFGLHLRYNWVDYNNPGGTPLDGEYLNIRLTVGSINNPLRSRQLRSLQR